MEQNLRIWTTSFSSKSTARIKVRLNLLVKCQMPEGYQSVKNILLACRNNPSIMNVYGVVAELIDVPKKMDYTRQLGSICNIVTYDEEDAKYIMNLRQRRLGRATFLPISSIRSRIYTRKGCTRHGRLPLKR